MHDGSAEEANCQIPLSLDIKTEATENDFNSNNCHQDSIAPRQSSTDACECNCHSNQTAESCENSKSHLVTDCKHCQAQRCLLFKDFSTVWYLRVKCCLNLYLYVLYAFYLTVRIVHSEKFQF